MDEVDDFFRESHYNILRVLLSISGLWPFHSIGKRWTIYLVFLLVFGSGLTFEVHGSRGALNYREAPYTTSCNISLHFSFSTRFDRLKFTVVIIIIVLHVPRCACDSIHALYSKLHRLYSSDRWFIASIIWNWYVSASSYLASHSGSSQNT